MLDEFEAREKREAELRERAVSDEQDLQNAFRALIGTADFKRVLFWLLERSGLYSSAFNTNEAAERFQLGRRSIGLDLLSKLNEIDARFYPRFLLDMSEMRELNRAAQETAARRETPEDGDDQYA